MRKDLVSCLKSSTVVITPLLLTGMTVLGHNPQPEYLQLSHRTPILAWLALKESQQRSAGLGTSMCHAQAPGKVVFFQNPISHPTILSL